MLLRGLILFPQVPDTSSSVTCNHKQISIFQLVTDIQLTDLHTKHTARVLTHSVHALHNRKISEGAPPFAPEQITFPKLKHSIYSEAAPEQRGAGRSKVKQKKLVKRRFSKTPPLWGV